MRWEQEGWRKLYTRDTATWAAMGYEGQSCLMMYLRTCEPDGTIAGKPAAIARFWRWPEPVVRIGLAELVALGTIRETERGFEWPKFAEAQQSRSTSAERSRRKRTADRSLESGNAPHNEGTHRDAKGREGTHRDDKTREEKRREEKNTAPPRAPAIPRGAYRMAWHDVRLLLVELEKPLTRDISWPVTEPAHLLDALRSMGGAEPLCEALRALQAGISCQARRRAARRHEWRSNPIPSPSPSLSPSPNPNPHPDLTRCRTPRLALEPQTLTQPQLSP